MGSEMCIRDRPRAAIGDYNSSSEELTLYTASQNPHLSRLILSAFNAVHPEHKFRIVAPDVGGGFGSKINAYAEDAVVAWASKKIERPVKWVAERSESFLSDNHGRDHLTHVEVALKNDGKITAIRVDTCLLYTSPSPRDLSTSRMPSSA